MYPPETDYLESTGVEDPVPNIAQTRTNHFTLLVLCMNPGFRAL